jgi:rare lipoprotein A
VIVSSAPARIATDVHTAISVRSSQLNVLDGHSANVAGRLLEDRRPGAPGQVVALQALDSHGWRTLAHTRTGAGGRFRLRYLPRQTTSEQVRLRFAGDAYEHAAHRRLGRLNVYRLAEASWYGGGGSLACGGSLTSATMGVANKTLPCGTLVTLRYEGRTVRVPVVDRGPYVAGREFDLTEATKQALGFGGVGQVWSTS